MTNQDVLRIALRQSAIDSGCSSEDFLSDANKVVLSVNDPQARRYLKLPFFCDLTSYGSNIVASVSAEVADDVERYIGSFPAEYCFETPSVYMLNDILQPHSMRVCFMAEYFLPDVETLRPLDCPYEMRLLEPADFADCYVPQWSNALCADRKHLDVLAIGAFDGDRLIGLAGCSADCDTMWQIGVDVLPGYRRAGVAAAVTSRLAAEVLRRGIVPFYCCAWANIKSVRNALRSGFRPAWMQMTAKSDEMIDGMIRAAQR